MFGCDLQVMSEQTRESKNRVTRGELRERGRQREREREGRTETLVT